MRYIPKPDLNVADCLDLTISKIRDDLLKTRFGNISNLLSVAETAYDGFGNASDLHTMVTHQLVGDVTIIEMEKLYSNRFSKKGQPGRPIYDKLKTLPKYGICPFCGQRKVSTLDHYLAKTTHASFTITPFNLIASCADCNKAKSNYFSDDPKFQYLHPYYDNIQNHLWLKAMINEGPDVSFVFFADAPGVLGERMQSRIHFQFSKLGLASLYASHAGSELENIKYALERLYVAGGSGLVRAELLNRAADHQHVHLNSWQSAMYVALSESEWFCDGGFRADD